MCNKEKLSSREKGYLEVLQRRADHLAARVASSTDKELHHDKHELSALNWAISNLVYFKAQRRGNG